MSAKPEVQERICPVCDGEGQVLEGMALTSPMLRPEIVGCPACGGTGEVDASWPEPTEDLYREAKAEEA